MAIKTVAVQYLGKEASLSPIALQFVSTGIPSGQPTESSPYKGVVGAGRPPLCQYWQTAGRSIGYGLAGRNARPLPSQRGCERHRSLSGSIHNNSAVRRKNPPKRSHYPIFKQHSPEVSILFPIAIFVYSILTTYGGLIPIEILSVMNGFADGLREDGFAKNPRSLECSEDLPPLKRVRHDSDTPGTSIGSSVCPHCYNDINSPEQQKSQIHPRTIPSSHIPLEEFKITINTAMKNQHKGGMYDEVKVLLLNWKANDLGLKTPEKGSLILDETMNLMRVFRDVYHFDTNHYVIPSESPSTKVQLELSKIIDNLSDMQTKEKKRALLIVYYNGHGTMKDGKLVWSA